MKLDRLALLLGLFFLLAVATLGCRTSDLAATATATQPTPVTGAVVAAEGTSLTDLQSLEVRDASGRVWRFVGHGFVGQTPSHLKQHIITGIPVIVTYEKQGDGTLVATRVEDGTLR